MTLRKNLTLLLLGAALLFNTGCDDKKIISAPTDNYIHVGQNWAELSQLQGNKKFKLSVKSKSDSYKVGEKMSFDVLSRKSGFLYVLYTNDRDETIWLYPNALSTENAVDKSHKFTIPPKDGEWQIEASAPAGKSLLTFFVFTDDTKAQSFFQNHQKDKSYSKDLITVVKKDDYGVVSVVIEVKE